MKTNSSGSRRSCLYAFAALLITSPFCQAQNLDLSDPGVTSGVINGAIYSVDSTHPAGTGIFTRDTSGVFLTIQGNGIEEGYNTSVSGIMDTKRVPQWNHELFATDLNKVEIGGSYYVPFLLDINEPANKHSKISVDDVRIFISPESGVSHQTLDAMLADPSMTLVYSLDSLLGDANSWVLLDYNRQSGGSGTADMGLFVPADLFSSASPFDRIYLYSKFGGDVANAEGGFEEWTLGAGAPLIVPEPTAISLVISSGILLSLRRSRKKIH